MYLGILHWCKDELGIFNRNPYWADYLSISNPDYFDELLSAHKKFRIWSRRKAFIMFLCCNGFIQRRISRESKEAFSISLLNAPVHVPVAEGAAQEIMVQKEGVAGCTGTSSSTSTTLASSVAGYGGGSVPCMALSCFEIIRLIASFL